MKNNHNITVKIEVYEAILRKEIGSDLTCLDIVLEKLNKDFRNKKHILQQGMSFSEISIPDTEKMKKREIIKCFKSIMGSFQDFIDKLVAVLKFKDDCNIILPYPATLKYVPVLLERKLQSHIIKVSTNKKLDSRKKINLLFDKSEDEIYKESIKSYFDLRNAFEHHKSIAKEKRVIKYKRLGIESDGIELNGPKLLTPKNNVTVKTYEENIEYDKGELIDFTEKQIKGIVFSLLIHVIQKLLIKVSKKLDKPFTN